MKVGIYIKAQKDGQWGTFDVTELDDESYKRFVIGIIAKSGMVHLAVDDFDEFVKTPLTVKGEPQ